MNSSLRQSAALVCWLLLSVSGCGNGQQPALDSADHGAVPVEVVTLQPQSWQGRITAFGVVRSAEQVDVSLDFSGVVIRVLVDEGERIERGQLLLELDTDKQQLRVQQALEAQQRARAAMEEARLNLERRQLLAERETVSREALDNAKLDLQRTAAQYRQALASRQLAQRILADSQVRSPVNGVVELQSVESGESVMAGETLLRLQAVDALEVQIWISESDIGYIRQGDPASVRLSGLPGQVLQARVESVGVNAHQDTGNYPVKLILEQKSQQLRPGMTATAQISGIVLPDVLLLPERALVDRDRRKVVYVLRDGRAQQIEPLLGAGFSDRLLVLSGLHAGDRLIVSNLQRVVDGSAVVEAETAQ